MPYFGAIALLTTADLPLVRWLPLLVLYNAIFVLPPVVLLVGHIVFGRRLDARYADLRERLQAGARETMLWIAGPWAAGCSSRASWSTLPGSGSSVMRPNC